MAKFIDVEDTVSELKKLIEQRENFSPRLWPGGRSVTALKFIIGWLEKRPVVDAAPVVHARWEWWGCIEVQGKVYDSYRCTRCKHKLPHIIPQGNYCLNCGAIMDLKEE